MTALDGIEPVAVPALRAAPSPAASLRAVVVRGLRDRRRSVFSWGASLGVYGAFMAAIYPSIQSAVAKLIKSYPAGLKAAFDAQSLSTVEGYIQAEMFSLIVPLAVGFFAIRAITAAIVVAAERGELDTILALPLSRMTLLVGTSLVSAVAVAIMMGLTGVVIFIAGRIAGTGISAGLVAAGVAGVWPLAMFSGGVAAVTAALLHSSRTATGSAFGVLVAMYAIDLAARLAHPLAALRWFSAFHYYGAPLRDGIDPASFLGLTAVAVALTFAGAWLLERRDVLH